MASNTPLPASPNVAPSLKSSSDVPELLLEPDTLPKDPSVHVEPLTEDVSNPLPPPSVASAATEASRGSWYASIMAWNTSGQVQSETDKDELLPQDAGAKGEPLTQSEQIKQDALARDDPPAPPTPEAEASPLITSDTKASWVSFFSSRNRAYIKPITDGKESQGDMEIMDIDDEMPPAETTAPATAAVTARETVVSTPPRGQKTQKITVAPSNGNSVPPSPTPSRPDTPATPLTTSKDVKKKTSAATTPGKKDAPKPRMPNLILPTWGDTFYCAPRSFPPPTKSTTLKKTFDAVTRMLASPLPLHPEVESYETERNKRLAESHLPVDVARDEQRRIARFVGTDLPRSWNILGSPQNAGFADVKRVVIIGVHGSVLLSTC